MPQGQGYGAGPRLSDYLGIQKQRDMDDQHRYQYGQVPGARFHGGLGGRLSAPSFSGVGGMRPLRKPMPRPMQRPGQRPMQRPVQRAPGLAQGLGLPRSIPQRPVQRPVPQPVSA